MLHSALPLAFTVELRMLVETELHRAADYLQRIDVTVGLGYDQPIDATRLAVRRSPVVLGSLRYGLDLLRSEPAQQILVGANDAARNDMMQLAALDHSGVVVGGGSVDHILIHVIALSKLQCILYDSADVLFGVSAVEVSVTRNYLFFDVSFKFGINHSLR